MRYLAAKREMQLRLEEGIRIGGTDCLTRQGGLPTVFEVA
jgi:hypothetical protein